VAAICHRHIAIEIIRVPSIFINKNTTRWVVFLFMVTRLGLEPRTPALKGICQQGRLTEGLLLPCGRRAPEGTRLHFLSQLRKEIKVATSF
jgi:hypothetical protein